MYNFFRWVNTDALESALFFFKLSKVQVETANGRSTTQKKKLFTDTCKIVMKNERRTYGIYTYHLSHLQ